MPLSSEYPEKDKGIILPIFYHLQNKQKYEKNLLPGKLPA